MKILLLPFFLFFSISLAAQGSFFNNTHSKRIGFNLGFSPKPLNDLLLDIPYDYQLYLFQFQYSHGLRKKRAWQFDVLVQPQWNHTAFRKTDNAPELTNGVEFGVNAGIFCEHWFGEDKIGIFACLSAGPHYVSGTPDRQRDGFIFSDNLFVGVHVKIAPHCWLDIRPGIRHISNANLKIPNRGVNNAILGIGMMWSVKEK